MSLKDQVAIGRVFELKARHHGKKPVCVLIIRDPKQSHYGHAIAVQVNETGTCSRPYTSGNRFSAHSMTIKDFTPAKVACRRRDLERFDARDIGLIRYGRDLHFSGLIPHDGYPGPTLLPTCFPDLTWTIFWTAYEDWDYRLYDPKYADVKAALHGDLHFIAYGKWYHPTRSINNQPMAWCTAKSDPRELRRIEWLLKKHHSDLRRTEISMRSIQGENGRIGLIPVGNPGPCVSTISSVNTRNVSGPFFET